MKKLSSFGGLATASVFSMLLLAGCGGGGGGASNTAGGGGGNGTKPVVDQTAASAPPLPIVVPGGSPPPVQVTPGGAVEQAGAPFRMAGPAVAAPPVGPKALVLYDTPANSQFEKMGLSYAIMLRNLLGHFNAQVDLVPVQQYTAGKLNGYDATFYLGSDFDHPLPAPFLADAAITAKNFVWFKYNFWKLTGDPAQGFAARRGFTYANIRGLNDTPTTGKPSPGFFDTVSYKGKDFVKYYAYDNTKNIVNADPDAVITTITDPAKATVVTSIRNPVKNETAPYVVRSGNFWYVADVPFSFIGPRDRYLVLADLLHDMVGINHAVSHQALLRLEDVDATVSPVAMKNLSDYLASKNIPFSLAVVPHYMDPFGFNNGGVPQQIAFADATDLRGAIDYAKSKGAQVVMHGYTHQYGSMKNPHTGVSSDDYEFWDIVSNKPVAEDSATWVANRLASGLHELRTQGYEPVAWETPHYHGSPVTSRTAARMFHSTYQRVVYFTSEQPDFSARNGKDFSAGQFFPYLIHQDHYGQRVIPENLGNIEFDIHEVDPTSNFNYTADDLILNAQYALTVRDGYASFFFHPFWVEQDIDVPGMQNLKKLVDAITQLGFTWIAPTAAK